MYTQYYNGKREWANWAKCVLSSSSSILEKMDPLEGGLLESGFEEVVSFETGYRTFLLEGIEVTVNLMNEDLFVQVGVERRQMVCKSHNFHKVFEVIRELWLEAQVPS
jgi:hypothetical protein